MVRKKFPKINDKDYRIKVLSDKVKSCAKWLEILQSISGLFAENQGIIYDINDVIQLAISPFHSINLSYSAIFDVVAAICHYWVDKGKLRLKAIDSVRFYYVRNKKHIPNKEIQTELVRTLIDDLFLLEGCEFLKTLFKNKKKVMY